MKELHRDSYILNIEFSFFFWKYKKKFEYKKAILKELLEFSHWISSENDMKEWLFFFLSSHGKISKREFKQINQEKMNEVIEYILRTFGKGFFDTKEKKIKQKAPVSSFFALIMKETGETTESILNLTWDQVLFISEGVVWNLNAQTKEGQRKNKIDFQNKQFKEEISDEEALRLIREHCKVQ